MGNEVRVLSPGHWRNGWEKPVDSSHPLASACLLGIWVFPESNFCGYSAVRTWVPASSLVPEAKLLPVLRTAASLSCAMSWPDRFSRSTAGIFTFSTACSMPTNPPQIAFANTVAVSFVEQRECVIRRQQKALRLLNGHSKPGSRTYKSCSWTRWTGSTVSPANCVLLCSMTSVYYPRCALTSNSMQSELACSCTSNRAPETHP